MSKKFVHLLDEWEKECKLDKHAGRFAVWLDTKYPLPEYVDVSKLKKERDELLAMLIEVRDDVCEHYNYAVGDRWSDDDGSEIKKRLDRLDALIARHS